MALHTSQLSCQVCGKVLERDKAKYLNNYALGSSCFSKIQKRISLRRGNTAYSICLDKEGTPIFLGKKSEGVCPERDVHCVHCIYKGDKVCSLEALEQEAK